MQIHGGEGKTKDIKWDFSVNINPFGMPKCVRDAFDALMADASALETYPERSCSGLRRAAAGHYGVPEDWIVCGCGASELIYKLAYLYRGRRALVVSPGFGEYEKALREAGCEVQILELKKERGFAFDEDFLERFCRAAEGMKSAGETGPELVFLCSPNNPVGGRIPEKMLQTMLNFCAGRGIRVVVDECFLPFVTGKEPTIELLREKYSEKAETVKSKPDGRESELGEKTADNNGEENGKNEKDHAGVRNMCTPPVLIKALTKSHAIPGVRLGLAISSDTELIRELQNAGAPWTVSGIAEKLGEAAFAGWDEAEFDAMRKKVAQERAYLEMGLMEAGATLYFGEGNFILFSVPEGETLFEYMRRRGILVRSCESFGLGADFYRIAVKKHEENTHFLEIFMNWRKRSL